MWRGLVIAVRFLTILPVPERWSVAQRESTGNDQNRSILYYPLVGLIIGFVLLGVCLLTNLFSPILQAVVVITVWVIITGALHLDGLADSADAWLGGHGDRERTLTILQDTSVGVAAVVALILALLLKVFVLAELERFKYHAIIIAPVIGRSMVLILFVTTRYVREQGIASSLTESIPRQPVNLVLLTVAIIVIAILHVNALLMLFFVTAGFVGLRYLMVRRLGGTTGDTAGALIEFSEIMVLMGLLLAEKLL